MSLSQELPNKSSEITVFQLLLEFVKRLRDLQDDPEALEKAAKASFALPSQQEALARESREQISKYESLLAQNKIDLDQIASESLDLENQKKDLDEYSKSLELKNQSLEKRKYELEDSVKENKAISIEIANIRDKLNQDLAKYNDDKSAFDEREKKVSAYEASLKDKAEKLRTLTDGM